jgi:hypothetical protein
MIKAFSNKFNAYQGLKGILQDHKKLYEHNRVVTELVDEFMARFEEIKSMGTKSDNKTNALTEEKYKLKELMADKASALGAAGIVYAIDIKDPELASLLKPTYSRIKYAKDAEAYLFASNIESTLRSHVEHLKDYMVTLDELDDLRETLKAYDKLLQKRGSVKSGAAASKKMLADLHDKMDALLDEKLDRMIQRMKREHADFARLYFQARKISDR